MFPSAMPGFAGLEDASTDSGEGGLRSVANRFFSTISGAAAQTALDTRTHIRSKKTEEMF